MPKSRMASGTTTKNAIRIAKARQGKAGEIKKLRGVQAAARIALASDISPRLLRLAPDKGVINN